MSAEPFTRLFGLDLVFSFLVLIRPIGFLRFARNAKAIAPRANNAIIPTATGTPLPSRSNAPASSASASGVDVGAGIGPGTLTGPTSSGFSVGLGVLAGRVVLVPGALDGLGATVARGATVTLGIIVAAGLGVVPDDDEEGRLVLAG